MFKSILVPIDLEDTTNAARALEIAIEQLRLSQGKLHVLTVMPDLGATLVAAYFPLDTMQQALEKMRKDLEAFVNPLIPEEIPLTLIVETGAAQQVIVEQSKKRGVDLIVMPAHNHPTLERWLVGSVTAKVVERAPVSVLVIRA